VKKREKKKDEGNYQGIPEKSSVFKEGKAVFDLNMRPPAIETMGVSARREET